MYNFLTTCSPNVRCRYHLQIYSPQGNILAEASDIQFWAMSRDKHDKFYGSYHGDWTLARCRIELEPRTVSKAKKR